MLKKFFATFVILMTLVSAVPVMAGSNDSYYNRNRNRNYNRTSDENRRIERRSEHVRNLARDILNPTVSNERVQRHINGIVSETVN